jgi:hypothetical protein
MCGILVTTAAEDFERVDADATRSIYAEVSMSPARFGQLLADVAD